MLACWGDTLYSLDMETATETDSETPTKEAIVANESIRILRSKTTGEHVLTDGINCGLLGAAEQEEVRARLAKGEQVHVRGTDMFDEDEYKDWEDVTEERSRFGDGHKWGEGVWGGPKVTK